MVIGRMCKKVAKAVTATALLPSCPLEFLVMCKCSLFSLTNTHVALEHLKCG